MDTSAIDPNTKLAAIYYNVGPQRHKKGEWCWVSSSIDWISRKSAVQSDDAHEWRRRENHVLDIWSVQY